MKIFFLIILLCNTGLAYAEDFDLYCAKTIKGKYTNKKKKSICWCIDDNYRSQLKSDERQWLVQKALPKKKNKRNQASVEEPTDATQKRLQKLEFETFKNCSVDYKWKANSDDIGVPDDITTP